MDPALSSATGEQASDGFQIELLLAESDALFRYALARVGIRALAEDLVQETLIVGVQRRQEFAGASSARTWLIGILRHRILNHFRWRARHPGDVANLDGEGPGSEWFHPEGTWKSDPNIGLEALGDSPARALERAEMRVAILDCVARLPDSLRRAYVLRELEEQEAEVVCETIDISRESLNVFLYRARQTLRACLQRKWGRV